MDPAELSSLNELLDRIAALGVAADYDRIGLKPDQREIKSPPITHQITVVEERVDNSSSILRMDYVRISGLEEPDTYPRGAASFPLNIESNDGPKKLVYIPEPNMLSSKDLQTPGPKLGQGSDLKPPTHPNTSAFIIIRHQSQETVHHFGPDSNLSKPKLKIAVARKRP